MKVNELRIGNLVTVNNPKYHSKLKGVILRVTSISQSGDDYSIGLEHIDQMPNTYDQTYSQFLRFIEPINISKDWLLKFGLKCTDGFFWVKNGIGISLNGNVYGLNKKTIKSVHQLQNFYFEATDEELAIA